MDKEIIDVLHNLLENSELTEDQKQVIEKYFFKTGRVCVDAGAGTGKTTTLIEVLSYIVVAEHISNPIINPFERIIVLSFGREASRQLKVKLKSKLRKIQKENEIEISDNIYRWLETESFIQTIDSYLIDLLKEISLDLSINPLFEIAPLLETDMVIDEIIEEMRRDLVYKKLIEELEEIYPRRNKMFGELPSLFEMLSSIQQKTREFCWLNEEYTEKFQDSVDMYFSNNVPPFNKKQVREIVTNLTSEKNIEKVNCLTSIEHKVLSSNLENIYNVLKSRHEIFAMILDKFDKLYTEKTRKRGILTYNDIAFSLWQYLKVVPDSLWLKNLNTKFDHILIDEFQDTSYVQCRIMSHLIRNDDNYDKRNKIMIIGDVKQSIYQWRSAEPGIFSSIINYSKNKKEVSLPFDIQEAEYVALTSNFRSKTDIVYLVNHIFSKTFNNNLTGRIGRTKVDYVALNPMRSEENVSNKAQNVHVLFSDGPTTKRDYWKGWKEKDAEKLVSSIKDIIEGNTDILINTDGEEKKVRKPLPGDIALLFRRRSTIRLFLNLFTQSGIDYSLIVDESLFKQHEISLLVDFLDWFANPHNKYALIHILRSPLLAISDETLRFLASQNFMLRRALAFLEENEGKLELNECDLKRLRALMKLRNDLRWDREGEKAALVEKIINHGAMDIVFLSSSSSSFETLANIQLFIELVKEWEEEELLSYSEFVKQIKILRDRAFSGKSDYSTIKFGDYESKNSIKIMTIHASKGLEFPIVVIPDLIVSDAFKKLYEDRLLLDREIGIAVKPIAIPINNSQNIKLEGPGKGRIIPGDLSSGIFWIHYKRDKEGKMAFQHPYNEFIKKQISEYWRLFYVATTRAKDHLIFHLGLIEPMGDKNSTWMYALQEGLGVLKNDEFVPNNDIFEADFEWKEFVQNGDQIDDKLRKEKVEINILKTTAVDYSPATFGEEDIKEIKEDRRIQIINNLKNIQFVPTSIAAKDLYSLLYCPRRYAYSTLNKIDSYYLIGRTSDTYLPPGSAPPKGINSATEWGDIVHKGFERLNNFMSENNEYPSEDQFSYITNISETDSVKQELEKTIDAYLKNKGISEILEKRKSSFLSEYELYAHYEYNDYDPVIINGTIDLLFQTQEGKWIILDYKTGSPPNKENDLYSMYENQLIAYVWLLKQNYPDIRDVEAKIIFVHPEIKIVNINYDLAKFEKELGKTIRERTKIDEIEGFKKYPSKDDEFSRCKTCPYAKEVGGPCEE